MCWQSMDADAKCSSKKQNKRQQQKILLTKLLKLAQILLQWNAASPGNMLFLLSTSWPLRWMDGTIYCCEVFWCLISILMIDLLLKLVFPVCTLSSYWQLKQDSLLCYFTNSCFWSGCPVRSCNSLSNVGTFASPIAVSASHKSICVFSSISLHFFCEICSYECSKSDSPNSLQLFKLVNRLFLCDECHLFMGRYTFVWFHH